MSEWLQQDLEDEYWARYDYLKELEAEHADPVAEYEHLIDWDMDEEEVHQTINEYTKYTPSVYDEDIPF